MEQQPLADRQPSRPFGVKAISVLYLVSAVSGLLAVTLLDALAEGDISVVARIPELSELPLVGLALLQIIIVIGFWRLHRWAWYLVMISAGITMAVDLWQYFRGNPYFLSMFINVAIVLYLNQREVQQAFVRKQEAEAVDQ